MTELCYKFAEEVKKHLQGFEPEIAMILGSGLGKLAANIEQPRIIKYAEIEGFPQSTVSGHAGQFVAGLLNGRRVLCMQGRVHLYEGHAPQLIAQIIKMFKLLNIKDLIVTNAAGSLRSDMPAGTVMMINDHINLSFSNPLIGPNDEDFGPRFPDLSNAYDGKLREKVREIAKNAGIPLAEGVYLMVSGPNFETAAEVRAFGRLGADAVGMSTVPEVIAAAYCGLRVVGFSVITNLGTGLQSKGLSHEETLAAANQAGGSLARLVNLLLEKM